MAVSDLHQKLCKRGAQWLVNTVGCQVAAHDLGDGEICDAVGFLHGFCIVLEAKVSRADFLRDAKKQHRATPEKGMGSYRYYITPPGLVDPSELPAGWGLIESKGHACRVVAGCKVKEISPWLAGKYDWAPPLPFPASNTRSEMSLLVGMVRRVHQPYTYISAQGKIVTKGMLAHLHVKPGGEQMPLPITTNGEGTHHEQPTASA